MIIYKLQNKINNKIYIGQTTQTLKERLRRHVMPSNRRTMAISRAIAKHGLENFNIEVVCECLSMKDLNEKESFYIEKYNSMSPNGYNLNGGGKNRRMSEETKKKISEAMKGKKKTPEHVKKVTESRLLSYKENPEMIKRLGSANRGKIFNSNRRSSLSGSKKGSSKYVGVISEGAYYRTEFYLKGSRHCITFNTEIEAAHGYDSLCVKYGLNPINFPNDVWDDSFIENIRRKQKKSKFQYYSVRETKSGKWQAMLRIKGGFHYLGVFDLELNAALAIDELLLKLGLPKRNFPDS